MSRHPLPRKPRVSPAPRMAPLAVLPLFLRLTGRRAVVAGTGEAALWKAELLAAAGADVEVHASVHGEAPAPGFTALAATRLPGTVMLSGSAWTPECLQGAALAVGALDDDAEAAAFRAAARAAGTPVNIVDRPELCDVQFGGIVNRSPLVIGISTDGAAPVFGQAVRTRIEALLPQSLARWAEAARSWRPGLQRHRLSFHRRRRFWELFTRTALTDPDRPPDAEMAGRLIQEATRADLCRSGRITLVGAGPGDPELLTLKAVRALQSADVIVHDDLVPGAILDVARREAQRIAAGKRGFGPSCSQADIDALVTGLARQGKHVVRLKSGDPMVFGRAGEEIAAARRAGIPVAVVPGISAAQGAAATLTTSLTHRDHAQRVQFVTGHGRQGGLPEDLDWPALADPAASTAIYMGAATFAETAARLVGHGLDPATPAVAVLDATRAEERVIGATVGTLAERLAGEALDGPVVILYGRAFAGASGATKTAGSGAFALREGMAAAPFP
jgi:uroporphyrin-III C-methyltransferase / precorrin-2 dehydrogenase / sirohydrochlorin ferrochelatase